MAITPGIPGIPQNFYTVQGDGKVALAWDISTGTTNYNILRSTDGVNFTTIATPTLNNYLDTSVSLGTLYYYQVSASNASGTSGTTSSQSVIPTMGGEMSLGELQTRCRQRADRLNSQFVTVPEVISYIQQSMYELYDLLIDVYEDYFKAPNAIFYSTGGSKQYYPVPNGVLTFKNDALQDFVPAPIYKLLGLDLGLNTSNNGWVTVDKYMFADRNKYFYPNTASTLYGVFNCQYRWMGTNLELIPAPSANQPFRIQYIPRLPAMIQETDMTTTSISGWLEYVITDVAIKILQKEESDVSVLMAQKEALRQRIMAGASNRDAGRNDSISDTRGNSWWNRNGGFNGPSGGW
jgi:hypothetical protein